MPDIQLSYSGTLLSDIDTTTGAKTFNVDNPLYNAAGILKVGIGTDHEEWFEVTAVNSGANPPTITTGTRGLSLTTTSSLLEVAGNRYAHAAGESIAIVTHPLQMHTQNTDTGTTIASWIWNSGGFSGKLLSSNFTANRQFTFPDATTTLGGLGVAQTWTAVQTFVAPVLGAATATTINKITITQPATGATLTIDDGFTLHATGNVTALSGSHTGTSSGTNTGDVTLLGTPNYITLAGQALTLTKLDLVDDLNTFSSANLASMVTDETGGGALVFATAPVLVSPVFNTAVSGTAVITGVGGSGSNTEIPSTKYMFDQIAAGVSGVSAINALTGSLSLTGGDYLTVTSGGSNIDVDLDFGDVWLLSQIFS